MRDDGGIKSDMFKKCIVVTELEDIIASYEYEKGMVLPAKSP